MSAARLGVPDAGLLSYGEMAGQTRDVAASASMPLIVDADTGFGNAQNVQRTVRGLASAGAACLMLEDQESPKRDFGAPGAVVSRSDALRRVKAAVQARDTGADILIIGRTDARNAAGHASGLKEALWRAAAFADLGVDLVFVTGPHDGRSSSASAATQVPLIVQVDEPGRPWLGPAQAHELGFEVALYGIFARARRRRRVSRRAGGDGRGPAAAGRSNGHVRGDRRHRRGNRLPRRRE